MLEIHHSIHINFPHQMWCVQWAQIWNHPNDRYKKTHHYSLASVLPPFTFKLYIWQWGLTSAVWVFSPPLWVCWRFLLDCVPDVTEGCTLTMLYENTLRLNHTFTSAGVHCLEISVRNDVSKLQTSFSLVVKKNSECPCTHTDTQKGENL